MKKINFGKKLLWRVEYDAFKSMEDRRKGIYCTKVFYILAETDDQARMIIDVQEHDCGFDSPLHATVTTQVVEIYE